MITQNQINSQFKEGEAVHDQADIHADLTVTRRRYWICCIMRRPDGRYVYRLKTKPKGLGGRTVRDENDKHRWFEEHELDYFPESP